MAKQNSASNVLEQSTVSGQASADMKGTHGSGYAALLIKYLSEKADQQVKIQISLKDKLKGMMDFSEDDFAAYFEETRKYRDAIKADADKAKLTVTKFRQAAPGIDYVYVSLSEFDRMARALKTGWKPDFDKAWAEIKASATERLDATGRQEQAEQVRKELSTVLADPKMDATVRQAHKTILENKLVELATLKPAKKPGQGGTTTTKTGFQQACEMLDKLPMQELELVQAWLAEKIEAYNKMKPAVSTTANPDPVETRATAPKKAAVPSTREEHATAEGSKRSRK